MRSKVRKPGVEIAFDLGSILVVLGNGKGGQKK